MTKELTFEKSLQAGRVVEEIQGGEEGRGWGGGGGGMVGREGVWGFGEG